MFYNVPKAASEKLPTKGIVEVDSLTFNKTISLFPYSFVRFTVTDIEQLSEEQKQKVG